MEELELKQALESIRKNKERKFDESIDLIVNLKKIDIRKDSVNTFATLPHKIKDKKICGFIDSKSELIDTIPKGSFDKYKDKKKLKKLVDQYDFFIASAPNMPAVATTFGKVLGPAGKMPSPKIGIISDSNQIKETVDKINKIVKLRAKEPAVKVVVGKVSMKDEEIVENIKTVYSTILHELPTGKDNIKSVMIKTTMGKPARVKL